jgi:subtilase family serine protease
MLRLCPAPGSKLSLFLTLVTLWAVSGNAAAAQDAHKVSSGTATPRALITQAVDESQLTVLKGNTHPLARPQFDAGAAPGSLPMQRMLLVLKRSPEQESALRKLIDDQQDKASPDYHKWLTPEGFGKQYGPSDSDVQSVTAWLQSHGFQVASTSKGRTVIEFSGTASQVTEAFHAAIHKYVVNGEEHWANASDPSIPAALAPAVRGVLTLHNFPRHPHSTVLGTPVRSTPRGTGPLPLFTFTPPKQATYYGLGPTDFATIYNVLPLWNAGIDGTGQTIAIVGETNIHLSDIEAFRSLFGLPAKDPTIILNGPDPGVAGDEPEAVLDVSWSGAVAKNATIDLVVSASTETALGVDLSALYIVDNNVAPVMSESYGECEAVLGNSGNAFYNALWQQAAAQGITVLISAGDSGSAVCDDFNSEAAASKGLAVSGFASTPYNVAVGGTDFDQTAATAPTYWNATNNATTGASAKSYIPETTWNDSCAGLGTDQCT